ncbi:MAG TPA: SIS domain-containing protein [bacterium]
MALKINLSEDRLATLDKSGMLGKTLELPQQILAGLDLGRDFVRAHRLCKPEALDWFGLGGSAVAADLLQGFGLEPPVLPLRIAVQRYPRESADMRLVSSYSGNTVESVHAFEATPPSRIWFTMSSGGRLQELSQKAGVAHLKLPGGYPPRAAVGFGLGAMIAIFDALYGFQVAPKCRAICETLSRVAEEYRVLSLESNPALALAAKLIDKVPVIYTVDGLGMPAQAFRFRAQLSENSKVWSHASPLPEMAHNEVEAFEFLGQVLPPPLVIFLGEWYFGKTFTDPRLGMKSLLDSYRISHLTLDPAELWGREMSRLETGLRMLLLLDAATVYLAVLRAQDPMDIPIITKLKNYQPVA